MDLQSFSGAHTSQPVHTGADQFGDWLTVAEAGTYCSLLGLDRTPKTIRKWAHRSHSDTENSELTVRREDVDNGFRWTIERTSLDRKIAQELEFEARRGGEPVGTGLDLSGDVRSGAAPENSENSPQDSSEQVRASAHVFAPVNDPDGIIEELRDRIEDLKGEVEFYRDELRDRRQTTQALADVIEAFRLTAQSNAQRAERETKRNSRQPQIFADGDNPE